MNYIDLMAGHIKQYISEHRMQPGEKLPPIREFVKIFKSSRETISNALNLLSYEGVIYIKPRQGACLSKHIYDLFFPAMPNWTEFIEKSSHVETSGPLNILRKRADTRENLLGVPNMDDDYINKFVITQAMTNVIERINASSVLSKYHIYGIETLKNNLCKYMAKRDLFVKPHQIIITFGVMNALSIIGTALFRRGIGFIHPIHSWLPKNLLNSLGINYIPIPIDNEGPVKQSLLNAVTNQGVIS
jgi:DNA-binding transcriptional MocR family regulator